MGRASSRVRVDEGWPGSDLVELGADDLAFVGVDSAGDETETVLDVPRSAELTRPIGWRPVRSPIPRPNYRRMQTPPRRRARSRLPWVGLVVVIVATPPVLVLLVMVGVIATGVLG